MSIQLIIVALYILALFGVSFYVKKRAANHPDEYLFAGRKLSTSMVAFNVTGLAVGAASTVGVAENATQVGIAAGWYNAAWAIGAVVMGLVAAGKYRELNGTTIPELFERYYDKESRLLSAIGLVILMACITSLQYVAGGAILSSLMPELFDLKAGMIVSAIVFIAITFIGGLWSSGLSNILSVLLIYLGVLYATIASVNRLGGLAQLEASLPPAKFDWFSPLGGLGSAIIIGWIVVMVSQAITAQGPVQIACGAKDAKTARNGFILGGILIFPIGFLCAILGLAAKVQFPDLVATKALPQIVMSLDPVFSGITLAALWAADVSTACTILLATGTLLSQDIYKRFINPNMDSKSYLKVNRFAILGIGLITLWFAFNAVGIVKTMLLGLSLTTAFTLVFLATIFTPSLCRKSTAFYTTLVGLLGVLAWVFIPAIHFVPHMIYFEWIICLITFFLVAIIDKRKIEIVI